jgi:hypothetical protein
VQAAGSRLHAGKSKTKILTTPAQMKQTKNPAMPNANEKQSAHKKKYAARTKQIPLPNPAWQHYRCLPRHTHARS